MKFKLLIKNKFISSIIGTICIFFGISFILPLNNFAVYITSYIHYKDEFVTMHYGLFINLIFSFAQTFSHSIGGYLENLLGFFKTIMLGFAIVFVANFFFIFQRNIWLCYFLSFIMGIGVGITISLLGKNLTFYYPNKKGIISGSLGLGIMIMAAIFLLGGEKLINFEGFTLKEEDNYYPPEIAEKTYLYFLIGECSIPFGLIFGLLLIYEYKPEDNQDNSNLENNEENKKQIEEKKEEKFEEKKEEKIEEKNEENEKEDELKKEIAKKRVKQVIKTLRFWRITLISFLINFSISFMVNTGRTFGALIGINGNALQFAGMLQLLAVIIVGPGLGTIVDKKGPLLILRIISISCIIPGILLTFFMSNSFVFISCFVLYVLNITGLIVSFGPFIMEVYGIQESVILNGVKNGFSKISDIITTVSAFGFSLVCEKEKDCLKVRYTYMYLISGICCVMSSLLLFIENNEKYNYDDDLNLITNENEDLKINSDQDNEKEKINSIY